MAIRLFRYGSLVLAVVGLAVLLLVASRSAVPAVAVGDLVGTMNWAYVRIEGVVTRQPAYDQEARTLKFWVRDGTGEIMVMAYRSEAEALAAAGLVPVMGDTIALEGTLRIREDFQYLVLNVPQHTEIGPVEPVEMDVGQVTTDLLYQKVTVRGVVRGDRVPYEGLRILTLRDASGEIEVTLSPGTDAFGEISDQVVGRSAQVTGAVDQYQDKAQISVGRGTDLIVLDEAVAIAPPRRIGRLSAEDVGRMATVEGLIVKSSPFSAGMRLVLDDGDGTVVLLLWQDVYAALADGEALVEGATVRVQGEIAEYRGELEIVPELPSDVVLLAAGERAVAERQLGELSAEDVGQMVGVEGVLRSLRTFSAGFKGTLDDGTGTTTLLLWQDVYDGLPDPKALMPGAMLHVEGEVSEYRGELEVIPQAPADVAVVGTMALPSQALAIGQITDDDVGQTVRVTGQVAEVVPFSKGIKAVLDDGTGALTLLLWQDLYDHLEDPAALVAGAHVSVWGEVAEYQGALEIVPAVPSGVEVTSAAGLTGTGEVAMALPTAVTPSPEPGVASTEAPELAATPTLTPTSQPTPTPTSPPPPSPTPTPAVETQTIGAITGGDVGLTFTVAQAGIADIDYFSHGVKYTLTDGSGSIILLVWQNVMEEIPDRYDLFPGSQVRVTGEIDEYQGELELVPQAGADVVLLSRGDRPPLEERAVGDITPSDEGRIFVVEGAVARTEGRNWLRVWINDGTGEILIFVPERTVAYLPAGIGAGVRLRVTGEVDIYKSVLEIIPLAGADVEMR